MARTKAVGRKKKQKLLDENQVDGASKAIGKRKHLKERSRGAEEESKSVADAIPEQSFDFDRLRAFHYFISEKFHVERNFFLKRDPANLDCVMVTNVPPYISTDSIRQLFCKYLTDESSVKEVVTQRSTARNGKLSEGYMTLSVRLTNELAVETAIRRCEDSPLICLSDEGIELLPCGPAKFAREYRESYLPINDLQRQVDEFMNAHDTKMQEEKRKAKAMRNVPDEEGWITVTRTSRKPPPSAVVVKNKRDLEKFTKKKQATKEDIAFYSFQLKESKIKRLEELRAKFEEDKKKIALAKAARKFRPT